MAYIASASTYQVQQRYEDAVVVDPSSASERGHPTVWAVFDGHDGDTVAKFLAKHVVPELSQRLPAPLAFEDIPHQSLTAAHHIHAELVRRAVLSAFLSLAVKLHYHLQCSSDSAGAQSSVSSCGSTATVAVQIGPLLTVANVGNTKCVLDVGHTVIECSSDHKLGNNEDEESRLDAIGARVARMKFDLSGPATKDEEGCGPLRLWPGGLHMSRAMGDFDCGQPVIPHPYIQQVWLPSRASRMIIATGGVWESFETVNKAADALRGVALPNAAAALLRRSLQHKQHRHSRGDLSVLVVDFVPEWCTEFRSQVRLDRLSCASTSSQHSSQSVGRSNTLLRKSNSASVAARPTTLKQAIKQPQQQPQQFSLHSWDSDKYMSPSMAGSTQATAASRVYSKYDQHAQQQPSVQHIPRSTSVLQRLLCVGTPAVFDGSRDNDSQQQQSPRRAVSLGPTVPGILDSIVPSNSARSVWRSSSLLRKSPGSSVPTAEARKYTSEHTPAKVISRCDTFQVYFKGQYHPLQQQLAMVELSLSRGLSSPACRINRNVASPVDSAVDVLPHLDSLLQHSKQQQQLHSRVNDSSEDASGMDVGFRRTSSDMSIASTCRF